MYGFQGVLLHLYQEHLALAVQLGLSAAELRRLRSLSPSPHVGQRLQEMEELRQALRQLWNSPEALDLVHNQAALPKRLREMFHQASRQRSPCSARDANDDCPDLDRLSHNHAFFIY